MTASQCALGQLLFIKKTLGALIGVCVVNRINAVAGTVMHNLELYLVHSEVH